MYKEYINIKNTIASANTIPIITLKIIDKKRGIVNNS